MTIVSERKLAPVAEWIAAGVPEVDAKLGDTHVYFPAHNVEIASRYPVFEDGTLVADVTQAQAAQFLRDYNQGGPALFEDEAIRDRLGRDHAAFDENFQRKGMPWRYGYILDFSKPYGNGAEGIDQKLVTRVIGYRLKDGDVELGVTTIAPSGMVPTLGREKLEAMIGTEGLTRLEKLRGKEIYEKGEQVVNVRNALGYPQLTFDHEAGHGRKLVPHSHHVYTPSQDEPERVGLRDAGWIRRGVHGCFLVTLGARPGISASYRSVPLVRGGIFGAKMNAVREYKATF
ncbi:MAG: hypothetical protein HY517_04110 [Candidatus Aenigmarchaeota archaeon]|nr:hypothetical protein [Candidatus Aenigmarchaeota archaeon]